VCTTLPLARNLKYLVLDGDVLYYNAFQRVPHHLSGERNHYKNTAKDLLKHYLCHVPSLEQSRETAESSPIDIEKIAHSVTLSRLDTSWTFPEHYKLQTIDFTGPRYRVKVGTIFPKTRKKLEKPEEVLDEITERKVWMKMELIEPDRHKNGAFSKSGLNAYLQH